MATETPYNWKNGDRTPSNPDKITTVLPNATSVETAVFQFGKVQARVEAEITNIEELTIADGATLTAELFWDEDRDGSFTNSRVISAYAPSGSAEVVSAGSVIGLVIPETDVELFCKVKYTASGDLSGVSAVLDLYPIV